MLGDPATDPYATMSCVFCGSPTTGTTRVGKEDWATCSKCNQKAKDASRRLLSPNVGDEQRATSKPAGPAKVVAAVATCSLPVLSVQAAIERLNEASDIAEKAGAFLYAATFRGVALNLRAEMALSKSRQPEENNQLRAICADLLPWARGCTTSNPARAKAVKLAEAVVMPNSR